MKKSFLKAIALSAAIALGSANVCFAVGGSIGHGNISVYKDGQLVNKLTGQNPLQDGALLVCDGKCMIKSEGISLIADDKAKVAVANEKSSFKLYMKEGRVDYSITSNVRTIAFYTPQGTYTVAEVVFNAGNQSSVKGSVVVTADGKTEISVTEGRMIFATAEGMKTVDANNKIILAVAPAASGTDTSDLIIVTGLVGGTAGVLALLDDDGDDSSASPSN